MTFENAFFCQLNELFYTKDEGKKLKKKQFSICLKEYFLPIC